MTAPTRVLVVDDSASSRLGLRRLLEASGSFLVVGEAATGAEAISLAATLRPDLVTMDVYLGGDDGLVITREMLRLAPVPIVIVTGLATERMELAFRATEVGAIDVLRKPSFAEDTEGLHARRRFVAALSALARVRIVGGRRLPDAVRAARRVSTRTSTSEAEPKLVLLGASTGGPAVLHRILSELPAPFPAAIVIVQHIERGFASGLCDYFATSGHRVELVARTLAVASGSVFVATDGAHLRLTRGDALVPIDGEPRRFVIPSIDELFESIPAHRAPDVFAAVLTGMGDDGAAGLLRLRDLGARTVAQSLATCVVPSMPSAAIARDAAERILDPDQLVLALLSFAASTEPLRRGDALP
jgi:two-component system, chemotaxis family, protein-glutamate methylesterase/glutaminase